MNCDKTPLKKNCTNFAYIATFSTSHTCHMWRISDFSTSVMWRHLKFLHMWRNFQFPHNCHTWKAEISPHDNFFSTSNISDIIDKYQVCLGHPVYCILPGSQRSYCSCSPSCLQKIIPHISILVSYKMSLTRTRHQMKDNHLYRAYIQYTVDSTVHNIQ